AVAAAGLLAEPPSAEIKAVLTGGKCTAPSDVALAPYDSPPPGGATVAAMIPLRIDAFKDEAQFAELFHYLTLAERACLDDARMNLETLLKGIYKPARDAWPVSLAAYKKASAADAAFADRLGKLVDGADVEAITKILDDNANEAKKFAAPP